MNWTKFAIATVIGGVVYFLLGWLVYGILLMDVTGMPEAFREVNEYPEEEFRISLMILSCLIYGAFLSWVAMKWAQISTFKGGFKMAAILGVFISLTLGLSLASMYKFASVQSTAIDALANIFVSGLSGGVIGWYLGR